jgi:hypothetical protein
MAGKTEYAVKTPQSACALPANRRLTPELAEDAVAHLERSGAGRARDITSDRPLAKIKRSGKGSPANADRELNDPSPTWRALRALL